MNALEELLGRRWITKSNNRQLYYKVKDQINQYQSFCFENLGFRIIVNPYLIKLEKIPEIARPYMGIQAFNQVIHYKFLCLILMFLEDKEAQEQFILSQLTEYIQVNLESEQIDWTLYSYRKDLVKVIKYCIDIGMIQVNDGSENQFVSDYEKEVLYENIGTSKYFMRHFNDSFLENASLSSFINSKVDEQALDKGILRRQRIYRKLLCDMVMYKESEDDADFLYLKQYHHIIERDLENVIECELQIYKTSAYLVLDTESRFGKVFPSENTLSDIILLCNQMIVDKIKQNQITFSKDETAIIPKVQFEALIESCKQAYQSGWIKAYRELTSSKFYSEIESFYSDYGWIEIDATTDTIKLKPIFGKIVGHYPKKFKGVNVNE